MNDEHCAVLYSMDSGTSTRMWRLTKQGVVSLLIVYSLCFGVDDCVVCRRVRSAPPNPFRVRFFVVVCLSKPMLVFHYVCK